MQCDRCAGETFTRAGRDRLGRQLWQLGERMALRAIQPLAADPEPGLHKASVRLPHLLSVTLPAVSHDQVAPFQGGDLAHSAAAGV